MRNAESVGLKKESKESNSKKLNEKDTIFNENSDFSDINSINSLQKSLKSIIGGRMFDLVVQAVQKTNK